MMDSRETSLFSSFLICEENSDKINKAKPHHRTMTRTRTRTNSSVQSNQTSSLHMEFNFNNI